MNREEGGREDYHGKGAKVGTRKDGPGRRGYKQGRVQKAGTRENLKIGDL